MQKKQLWRSFRRKTRGRRYTTSCSINNSVHLNLGKLYFCARLFFIDVIFGIIKQRPIIRVWEKLNGILILCLTSTFYIECLRLIKYSISSKSIISLDAQWDENLFAFVNVIFLLKIISHCLSIRLSWEKNPLNAITKDFFLSPRLIGLSLMECLFKAENWGYWKIEVFNIDSRG